MISKHWHSSESLKVIHTDICGFLRVKTHRGMEYFFTFVVSLMITPDIGMSILFNINLRQ